MQTSISGIVIIVGVVGRAGEGGADGHVDWTRRCVAPFEDKSSSLALGWVGGMVAEPSQISRHLSIGLFHFASLPSFPLPRSTETVRQEGGREGGREGGGLNP